MNSDVTSAIAIMEQVSENFAAVQDSDTSYHEGYTSTTPLIDSNISELPETTQESFTEPFFENVTTDVIDADDTNNYSTEAQLIDLGTHYESSIVTEPAVDNCYAETHVNSNYGSETPLIDPNISDDIPVYYNPVMLEPVVETILDNDKNDTDCYQTPLIDLGTPTNTLELSDHISEATETNTNFPLYGNYITEQTEMPTYVPASCDRATEQIGTTAYNPFGVQFSETTQTTSNISDYGNSVADLPVDNYVSQQSTGINGEHGYSAMAQVTDMSTSVPVYDNHAVTETYQDDLYHPQSVEYNETTNYLNETPLIESNKAAEILVFASTGEQESTGYSVPSASQTGKGSDDDNSSYNSETPLIDPKLPNNSLDTTTTTYADQEPPPSYDGNTVVAMETDEFDADSLYVTVIEDITGNPNVVNPFASALSLYSEQQAGTMTPIPVIGGGWEFGSVCSINLHADVAARAIEANSAQGRLLSRIFSKTVGYLEIRSQKAPLKQDLSRSEIYKEPIDLIENAKIPAKGRNLRNLLILSISMTLLHIAAYGLRNLQSSLNSEAGLGVFSLAAVFAAFMIGSLASPFLVKRFPPKYCLCLATAGHLPYLLANYYPTFYTMILSSALMGFSGAVIWNAICTYITEIGIHESALKSKKVGDVLSRYFGIFFLILQFSVVIGNLISSIVLSSTFAGNEESSEGNTTDVIFLNKTVTVPHCGVHECNDVVDTGDKPQVGNGDKLLLLGSYSACVIVAIFVLYFMLDCLPNFVPQPVKTTTLLRGVGSIVAMLVDRKFVFIVPLCMYTLFSNGFIIADVLKAYITCPLGVQMVGYSMICFGVGGSMGSYVFGKLTKHLGRITVFLAAAVLNLASLGLMAFWDPTSANRWFLLGLLGLWGVADGIWQSQINSLISTVFADRYETAFSCCRVLQGLAGIVIFLLSNAICMVQKIIFIGGTCILSLILYIVMEVLLKREQPVLVAEVEVKG